MSATPRRHARTIGRRRLLRDSGLVVSLGAIVAACGDTGGLEEPGRVGVAPTTEPLPDAEVDDVVLLRTAQSFEYTALAVYDVAAELDVLDASAAALAARFVEDHTRHADRLAELITDIGGEPYPCANTWYTERVVGPVLDATEGTDDLERDVLHIAHAFEGLAGSTYQMLVSSLSDPELRREAILIGADEARHAATLAMAMTGTPEGYIAPSVLGQEAEQTDDQGFPIAYAIPSTFGQLGTSTLVVGPRDEGGGRFSIVLQTPAQNSFVYDYMSC